MSNNTNAKNMPPEELARWLCLLEGIDILFGRMEELNMDTKAMLDDKKTFKRIHKSLNQYIKDRFNAMLWDIKVECTKH